MPAIKAHIKKLIPVSVLALRHRYLEAREARMERRIKKALERCVDAKDIFTKIYDGGYWGRSKNLRDDKYYSGLGSHSCEIVDPYIAAVKGFLVSTDKQLNAVDLGCGDFAVGSQIRPYCNKFIGGDVVERLINRNRERYGKEDVEFCVLDIINDDLPGGDLVFLRQVLQHLSNSDIEKVVAKLSAKYRFIILTEHLPLSDRFVPNLDKKCGHDIRINIGEEGSGVILTKPPFNLKVEEDIILCEVFQNVAGCQGIIRTNLYRL